MTTDIQPAKPTFRDLVALLADADNAMTDPNFDPAVLVGEIRDKVDAIKRVLDLLDATGIHLEEQAEPILVKARAYKSNYNRLRAYVATTMRDQSLQRIPGDKWAVRLRDAQPSLVVDREPTALDFEKWPNLVKQERFYVWNKPAVKEHLLMYKDGPLNIDLPARLTYSVWPEFKPLVPESLEPRKRKK